MSVLPLCLNCKNYCTVQYDLRKKNLNLEVKNCNYCKYFKKIVNTNKYLNNCTGHSNTEKNSEILKITKEQLILLMNNRENDAPPFIVSKISGTQK